MQHNSDLADTIVTEVSTPLEDYGLLSNRITAALVSRDGSIDWFCPIIDGDALFTAILGHKKHGRWQLSVVEALVDKRWYDGEEFRLRTIWHAPNGVVEIDDELVIRSGHTVLQRKARCVAGHAKVALDFRPRAQFGATEPLIEPTDDGLDIYHDQHLKLRGPKLAKISKGDYWGSYSLSEGEELQWELDCGAVPEYANADTQLAHTPHLRQHDNPQSWDELVRRSVSVLAALTLPNGATVAAPTASLPEDFGGVRNWDYRYCWLRDSAFTIEALLIAAKHGWGIRMEEASDFAKRWRDWVIQSCGNQAERLQIMYSVDGNRELSERMLAHLPGYERSMPVRVGNGAAMQYQADVVGELMVVFAQMRAIGIAETEESWAFQQALMQYCITHFERRDHGIWEMRGELHYFTHGRAMMWAAFNEAITAVETQAELEGEIAQWYDYREQLRQEIFHRGYNEELGHFTQTYDTTEVDSALLQLPQIGLLPPDDPAMLATVTAIEEQLIDEHGLVYRYRTHDGLDGLAGDEYPFLICNFWLVEQYARSGRVADGKALMRQLASYATDLQLLSEEYSPQHGRLAGNFPQAFSHIGVIRAAAALADAQEDVVG